MAAAASSIIKIITYEAFSLGIFRYRTVQLRLGVRIRYVTANLAETSQFDKSSNSASIGVWEYDGWLTAQGKDCLRSELHLCLEIFAI